MWPLFSGGNNLSGGRMLVGLQKWLLGLLALAILASCSQGAYRKRSFVGQAGEAKAAETRPVGLNPLGKLDICRPAQNQASPLPRALVSNPELFTTEASKMISALEKALSNPPEGLPPVEFLQASRPLIEKTQAAEEGKRCEALIVLWEPGQTKTLELTLPHPSQIPLKNRVHERLCEFGNHREQLEILYLTIVGLLAMRENDYDRAVLYLDTASRLNDHCLVLPGSNQQ